MVSNRGRSHFISKLMTKIRAIFNKSVINNLYIPLEFIESYYSIETNDIFENFNSYHQVKIDIIIPIYNSLDYVSWCIKSVIQNIRNDDQIITNVILVNDSSNAYVSAFLDKLEKDHDNIALIINEQNLGFVQSCNKGLTCTSGDIVVLLNSDTIIPPNFCERIVKCFKSDSTIGIASPLATSSVNAGIELLPGYNVFEMQKLIGIISEKKYPDFITPEGFCFCISRECINSIGVLDEIYEYGYCEESDYSMRALYNGFDYFEFASMGHPTQVRCSLVKREEMFESFLTSPPSDEAVLESLGRLFGFRGIVVLDPR